MSSCTSLSGLSIDEQTSLVAELLPQFEGIASVLQVAVKSASVSISVFTADCSGTSDILETIESLVSEILCTVLFVIEKIGLGMVFCQISYILGSLAYLLVRNTVEGLLAILQLVMVSLGSLIRIITSTVSGLDELLSAVDSILNLVLGLASDVLSSDPDIFGLATGLLGLLSSVL